MPLDVNELKSKFGQNAGTIPKKTPSSESNGEPFFEDEQKDVEDPNIMVQKKKLIEALFDENKDIPMEEILTSYFLGDGNKMAKKTTSSVPLTDIKGALENMLSIQHLADMVMGFRDMKKNKNKEVEEEVVSDNSMLTMLPFLQKMQNGGLDVSKLDPLMLMMAMGMGGQKSNNNMGQLFLMMSMANMFAQQPSQPQPQKTPNGNYIPNQQQSINPDMIRAMWQELQNVMQSQQKPPFDPIQLLMIDAIKKSNTPQTNQNIEVLLDKFNTMLNNNQAQEIARILERQNEKWERGMQVIAQAINRDSPEEKLWSNFKMFKEMQGEQRQMSKDEMEYNLRKKEIELKDFERRDMLDREERSKELDNARSDRIMQTANIVLDKVIGNGLGSFVKDVMSVKGDGKRRGRDSNPESRDYDPSLLDDL